MFIYLCGGLIKTYKKHELENLVESSQPDIVIGTESWLNKDIQSSEVFSI